MAEPFLGELRLMSFNFNPRAWALCNGQLLPVNANQALFSLLGTRYGGDGRSTFALPDLRGRVPLAADARHPLGDRQGSEGVRLDPNQLYPHTHTLMASSTGGDSATPTVLASAGDVYAGRPANLVQLGAAAPTGPSIAPAGADPHENMMPFLVLNFCIALVGIFPSRD